MAALSALSSLVMSGGLPEHQMPSRSEVFVFMAAGMAEMGTASVLAWIVVYSRKLLKTPGESWSLGAVVNSLRKSDSSLLELSGNVLPVLKPWYIFCALADPARRVEYISMPEAIIMFFSVGLVAIAVLLLPTWDLDGMDNLYNLPSVIASCHFSQLTANYRALSRFV